MRWEPTPSWSRGRGIHGGMNVKQGALTVTRKAGEGVLIGDDIVVELVTVRKNQVRLRIHAPGVEVLRHELVDRPVENKNVEALMRLKGW